MRREPGSPRRVYTAPMLRRSLQAVLLVLMLLPALTGWAGDACCPSDEPVHAACGDCPDPPAGGPGHEDTDPGHQQALCGCACHALLTAPAPAAPDAPAFHGLLETQFQTDPSNEHLSAVYRPPLA